MVLILLYAPMKSNPQDTRMATNETPTTHEPSQNSTIHDLTEKRNRLQDELDWWNTAYIVSLALTVAVVVAAGISQFKSITRAKALVAAQSELESEKDRQSSKELASVHGEAGKANERAGKLEVQAAEASARAEGFRLDIAKAEESAKQAEARAAEANLALARFRAPRSLSPEQNSALLAALRPFSGTRYNLFAVGGDSEIIGIANQILNCLSGNNAAGWVVTVGSGQDSAIMSSGILVELAADADTRTRGAALTFIATIRSFGFDVTGPLPESKGAVMGNTSRDPNAKIRIVISKKP
jgi:hypothetical protein